MPSLLPNDLQVPVLETERLKLRGHRLDDFSASAAMWADPNVTRHIGGQPLTEEEAWTRFLRYAGHWNLLGFGYWAVEEKATGSFAAVGGYYVTYLGLSDAYTAEHGGATDLTYNGVAYSTNAVQEGQYTFWGYEHLDYTQGYTAPGKTVADLIANKLYYQDADVIPATGNPVAPGIRTIYMNVERTTDGGTIFNNY